MASLSFVTPEEHHALQSRFDALERFVGAFVNSIDDDVPTKKALQLTGIKSRTTLIEERDRPGSLIRYSKHGRSASYSRQSCIAYKLAQRISPPQPPAAMRVAS